MFYFDSRICHDKIIVCLEESLPNAYATVKFSHPKFFDGRTIMIGIFEFLDIGPDMTIDKICDMCANDPVTNTNYTLMCRIAFEFIFRIVMNTLESVVEGNKIELIDMSYIYNNPDTAWQDQTILREIWKQAAIDVKEQLLQKLSCCNVIDISND